jgi:hypothetical protein
MILLYFLGAFMMVVMAPWMGLVLLLLSLLLLSINTSLHLWQIKK